MATLDWMIVAVFVICACAIGFRFSRRASRSAEHFFVAGRSLPWFVAGTSMVATTFSSDTPLWVSGLARNEGVSALWFFWAGALGTLATVFFFARLWRRSEVLTEAEFVALRYDPDPAMHGLRIFKALFDGLFVNCAIMASVTLAMSKVLSVILALSPEPVVTLPLLGALNAETLLLIVLGVIAVLYTMLSGLYGVVYTDLIQFGFAMIGAIALAVIVYVDLAPKGGVMAGLEASPVFLMDKLRMFPEFGWNLETLNFFVLMTVGWFFVAPGTGYYLQRVFATRTERDAMLSLYWYCICNYVIRTWPWIVVGVASIIYFPRLVDAEQAYPEMINMLLPLGLKGVMVASILAAFMSTLDTHLNWGSSYLVNDVYRPFVRKDAPETHYVRAARLSMLALVLLAVLFATQLTGVLGVYKFLAVFWAGLSFSLIVRWYWWRIDARAEIACLMTAVVAGSVSFVLIPDAEGRDMFAVRMVLNFLAAATACILVALWTGKSGPSPATVAFYRKMRIHGPGWERVRKQTGVDAIAGNLKQNACAFAASAVLIYALVLGTGYALFARWPQFLLCVILTVGALLYLRRNLPPLLADIAAPTQAGAARP